MSSRDMVDLTARRRLRSYLRRNPQGVAQRLGDHVMNVLRVATFRSDVGTVRSTIVVVRVRPVTRAGRSV
jgi:hypothetical protein